MLYHYRCFVSRTIAGKWQCHHEQCNEASQGRARSSSELSDGECKHIRTVIEEKSRFSDANLQHTHLSPNVLKIVPFPPSILTDFENYVIKNKLDQIIQRVSDKCFVVQTASTSEAPLGIIHVRVDKNKQFHCTCNKFKHMVSFCGATTAPKLSKRCIHIYICLWAVFSLCKDHDSEGSESLI